MNRVNISPSLLSADFTRLKDDIKLVEDLGVSRLHLDVMDGHFVPNLTFGPFIISDIRKITNLHLETHLMIAEPHKYIKEYAKAGSDTIIVHYEASDNLDRDIKLIKDCNVLAGIAINPDTPISNIASYIPIIDYILIMSVFPGFGGQSFIDETLNKMKEAVRLCKNHCVTIGVDGGVNLKTIKPIYQTGIDVTIIGSALYGAHDITKRYQDLTNG